MGGRALHREVQRHVRMASRGIAQYARVARDQGVDAMIGGTVHCALPARPDLRLRVGVDRHIELALVLADMGDSGIELLVVHVQPRKVPSIGVIAKPYVHRIGALAHGGFQRRQVTRRTNQLHDRSLFKTGEGQERHCRSLGYLLLALDDH